MTTGLHLLRKDIRLLRLPIAAWLGVLSLQVLLTLSRLDVGVEADSSFEPWVMAVGVLNFAHFVFVALLMTGVAQTDPPVAPTAFWATRPIGRWPLLAAKLLFGFVVVVLPWTFAHFVALTGRGFAAADVLDGWLWLATQQVLLLLACLAIGALTERLPHAVVALVGLGTLVTAAFWAAGAVRRALFAEALRVADRRPEQVAALAAIMFAAVAIGCAYTRRARLATALVVMGGPVAVALLQLSLNQNAAALAPLPAGIGLEVLDASLPGTASITPGGARRTVRWGVAGTMAVAGAPAGTRVRTLRVTTEVSWPGGRRERAAALVDGRPAPAAPMPLTVEGLGVVTNLTPDAALWLAAISPRAWQEALASGQVGIASSRVELRLVRARVVARLPLQPGAASESGSERIVVTEVAPAEGRVEVHEFGLWTRPALGRMNGPSWREVASLCFYAFHNPGRRELIAARPVAGRALVTPVTAAGARIERYSLELETPPGGAGHLAWLAGAQLVKIEETTVAHGERRLEGQLLSLGPMPPDLR